jgi:iron uptake system component EfeO
MNRTLVRAALCLGATALLAMLASACGSSGGDSTGAEGKTLSFTITDAGCEPHDASAPAGPIDFDIASESSTVTELEILDGETILGERENLTDGLTANFSLTLEEGEYILRCNGGSEEDGTLKVSGELKGQTSPEIEAAIAKYREYLEQNSNELVEKTKPFVAAIVAGEIEKAKSLYGVARPAYERIEPVAESFGDLDPRIDARENDVPPHKFGGFHRLEKALWEEETTAGMAPVAEQLLADVEELDENVREYNLQAVQIANGANELLSEVSSSKISGEEERYSHIDLVDFQANVEGSQVAFEEVEPLMKGEEAELAREIEADFKEVDESLEPYRRGDGFVPYTELTKADTRKLAQGIDALAEKISHVPAVIVRAQNAAEQG